MAIGGSNAISGGNPVAPAAVQPSEQVSNKRAELQAQLLKKILDSQQQQATLAANELQGKGQLLDIRA